MTILNINIALLFRNADVLVATVNSSFNRFATKHGIYLAGSYCGADDFVIN